MLWVDMLLLFFSSGFHAAIPALPSNPLSSGARCLPVWSLDQRE
jgi:hypothetical protein